MKKLISLLLAVLLLVPALCAAEGTEIAFGAGEEEVLAALGEPDFNNELESTRGPRTVHSYHNQPFEIYRDASVAYQFNSGVLTAMLVHLGTDGDRERFAYLRGALEEKYGPVCQSAEVFDTVFEYFSAPATDAQAEMDAGNACVWNTEDGLMIVMYHYGGSGEFTALFFLMAEEAAIPATEATDEAVGW